MKVAALGYYGFGNLGDEAVLAGIRTALATEARFDKADFLVLSNAPAETPRLHPGTSAVNRWKWREVASALSGTDLFIFGGGSLLQDATSVKSVIWYALMAQLARRKAKRVLWWGQGVGPLHSNLSRFFVRGIGNQADAITVRDEKSAELLKAIGIRGSIETVADPAFALEPDLSTVHPSVITAAPILVALRSWQNNAGVTAVADKNGQWTGLITEATGNANILPWPMHLPEDSEFLQKLYPLMDWKQGMDWRSWSSMNVILAQFAAASMIVAMRLHALIFAARCGVPFVALSYDPKVDALVKACGQEDALVSVNDGTLTRTKLLETIARVQATKEERRLKLGEFAAAQAIRARRPARIAAELF